MQCKVCGVTSQGKYDFCPSCGAYTKHQGQHQLHVPKFNRHGTPARQDEHPAEMPPPDEQEHEDVTPPRAVARPAANVPAVSTPGAIATNGRHSASGHGTAARALVAHTPTRALAHRLAQRKIVRRSEPFPTYAVMMMFMAVWLLALLIGFGAAGVYQGMEDRTRIALDSAQHHKALAKGYIKAGNIELAIEELKYARQFNPKDREIVDLLASLTSAAATPAPTPVRPTPIPLPTAIPTKVAQVDAQGPLFNEAKSAFDAKDYEKTATVLENLRRIDPAYRKADVEPMLYTAYLSLARQYLSEQRWEEGIQKFDKALAIRNDEDVALERYLASNYLRGLSSWGADWKRAVESFVEIVRINPEYRDSTSRLYVAYGQYGDILMARADFCLAQTQFERASAMAAKPELDAKRAQAAAACASGSGVPAATPLPGQSPAATATPVPPAPGDGKYTVVVVPAMQGTTDDTGSIRGSVVDKVGKPIFQLEIVVRSTTKAIQRVETTDEYGFFGFDGLEGDTYVVYILKDPASVSAPVTVGRKVRALINFTAK